MVYISRGNGVVTQRTGVIHSVRIDGESCSLRIETVQTSPAAHPEEPACVLTKIGIHLVVTLSVLLVHNETLGPRVKSIKTIVGSDPHGACMIDQHPAHYVAAQAGWVLWVVQIGLETSGSPIELAQSGAVGTDPETAAPIFSDRDYIARQSLSGRLISGGLTRSSIDAIQRSCRCDPQNLVVVFIDGAYNFFAVAPGIASHNTQRRKGCFFSTEKVGLAR